MPMKAKKIAELEEKNERDRRNTIYLEGVESSPLVGSVIKGDTTFKKEIEDFYSLYDERYFVPGGGASGGGRWLNRTVPGDGRSIDPSEKPERLIELVSGFDPVLEDLDDSLLTCSAVRDSYRANNTFRSRFKRNLPTNISFLGIVGGILGMGSAIFLESIPIGILSAGSIFLGGKLNIRLQENGQPQLECGNAFREYLKLRNGASAMDRFIEKHYRAYFVRRCVDEMYG